MSKLLAWAGLDLNQTEIQNARIQNLGADPGSPLVGQFWYRTDTGKPMIKDATTSHHIGDGANAATLNGKSDTAFADKAHNLVDTTNHPVSGLTAGHVLKALTATTYGFAAPTAASTTVAGVVQLQDDLLSTSTVLALTANQGKLLNDNKVAKISGGTSGNFVTHNAAGVISDSGLKLNDSGTTTSDLWSASKINTVVTNATSGLASSLHAPVADLTAAVAVNSAGRADKMLMNIESLGLYRFDAESTVASNGDQVIRPTDVASDASAGRWIKLSSTINDHNGLGNMQGGTTGQYYHLTSTQYTALNPITGLSSTTPAAPGTGAVGTGTTVARADHVHDKQIGFSKIHALNGAGVDLTNSPFTAASGVAELNLKQGTNITLEQAANGVITISATGSGTVGKDVFDVGNGALTDIPLTHTRGTRDVAVEVYLNSGTYEKVLVDVEHTSTTVVTLKFAVAPSAAQYRCVVIG